MNKQNKWINRQARLGGWLLAGGIIVVAVGAALELTQADLPFDARLVTALGILLLGGAAAYLVRYRSARKDPTAAQRLITEESDERNQLLRQRAGSRAYTASLVLAMIGLMWVSWAANGSLPPVSDDLLWYFLAGLVIAPGLVYLASMLMDDRQM